MIKVEGVESATIFLFPSLYTYPKEAFPKRATAPSYEVVFDGLPMTHSVIQLRLTDVQKFDSGAVWLRYSIAQ